MKEHHYMYPTVSERQSILTAVELANRWGVTAQHIHDLHKQGVIPGFNLGTETRRLLRFHIEAIEAYELAQSKLQPPTA